MNDIHRNTPEIQVFDSMRQTIRLLRYHRAEKNPNAQERIERYEFNTLGHLVRSQDARFFEQNNTSFNFAYLSSLSGKVLRTNSVDAGKHKTIFDIEGRPALTTDARGTTQRYEYDELGRPISRSERMLGQENEDIAEQWEYGALKDYNMCGKLKRHFDTAGLLDNQDEGYSIDGHLLSQKRYLFKLNSAKNWNYLDSLNSLEIDKCYKTQWQYNLNGQVLAQTDASGHLQVYSYDVSSRLKSSKVTLCKQSEQTVLRNACYNAAGQTLSEEAGNGVVTKYEYEPKTLRLRRTTTTRADNKGDIQDLYYTYDPVGNLEKVHDKATPESYYRNTKTNGTKTYRYDSLYQLVEANGRENARASNGFDPSIGINVNDCIPYTRKYEYDEGGNLAKIQHFGANGRNFTRNIQISLDSNRAVHHSQPLNGSNFDKAGNLLQLHTGQNLTWNGLNQLQSVNPVANDTECYQYDGHGMRVRKTNSTSTKSNQSKQNVVYLPGLEIRETGQETLEVITIGAAGRGQVRLLHWVQGLHNNDGVTTQMRYTLDDHLGLSQIELDGNGDILTKEEFYPYGGTAVLTCKSGAEVKYKFVRYSGKERDASGLYYYGHRYYQPSLGRWLSPDPAGTVDGLNLFRMVKNNPIIYQDSLGEFSVTDISFKAFRHRYLHNLIIQQ